MSRVGRGNGASRGTLRAGVTADDATLASGWRLLLNILLGNGDAHMKNFSMLEDDHGQLRLSPAYDIVCSKAVIEKEMDCALTLNGKKNKVGRLDFVQVAALLKIPTKVASGIFERFSEANPILMEQLGYSRLPDAIQDKVRRIFEDRHHRLFA